MANKGEYNNIPKAVSNVEQAVTTALTAAAAIVLGNATARCPVGQYPPGSGRVGGNLKSSLTYSVSPKEARVGTNVDYSIYVEMGTRKMSARPYLKPALHDNQAQINEIMKKVFGDAVRRACR